MRAEHKHFGTICAQTFDNSPTFSNSSFFESVIISTRDGDFAELLDFLVCQFEVSFHASLLMSFHITGPSDNVSVRDFFVILDHFAGHM